MIHSVTDQILFMVYLIFDHDAHSSVVRYVLYDRVAYLYAIKNGRHSFVKCGCGRTMCKIADAAGYCIRGGYSRILAIRGCAAQMGYFFTNNP